MNRHQRYAQGMMALLQQDELQWAAQLAVMSDTQLENADRHITFLLQEAQRAPAKRAAQVEVAVVARGLQDEFRQVYAGSSSIAPLAGALAGQNDALVQQAQRDGAQAAAQVERKLKPMVDKLGRLRNVIRNIQTARVLED